MSAGHAVVLGGHGFLGRHVCRELARRGLHVSAIGHGAWTSNQPADWGISDWTTASVDSASLAAIARAADADLFVHCAGSGSVAASYTAPLDDYQRNVDTTAALLEFVRHGCQSRPRVVFTSSAAVYGDQGEVDHAESATRSPMSPYGFHKVMAENLCDSYARFFGVATSVVRLFSVYGEGLKKQLLWDAANRFSRGEGTFFGTGREVRDWVHVDDAAALLCDAGLVTGQDRFEIYNGGHAHHDTAHVLGELARQLQCGCTPVFSGQTHVGNPRRLTANASRARRQLGWAPRVDLAAGLARYASWFNGLRGSAA